MLLWIPLRVAILPLIAVVIGLWCRIIVPALGPCTPCIPTFCLSKYLGNRRSDVVAEHDCTYADLALAHSVGRAGPGRARHRRQLRCSPDWQHGRADHLALRPTSRALALLRGDGDDWRSDRRLHDIRSGPKRGQ